jgi:hypothetical protein
LVRNAAAVAILGFLGFGADNINFDNQTPGSLPSTWSSAAARPGQSSHWEVRVDPTAPSRPNVLEQVSAGASEFEYPLAIFDKVVCRDGDLSVKFKIDGGRRSKTAGIIWRYQDPKNYYLLHFSVDEKNIVLFRVQNGKAQAIAPIGAKPSAFGVFHDIRLERWYVAKVVFRGSRFHVLFGNRSLFEVEDSAISAAGKTGVWTKGRTTAEFDDFRIDKKG